MHRTRRTLRWAAAATVVALTATGCNLVGAGEDDSNTDDASGATATVTVALVPDPPGASEFYRAQFDLLEEENPGLTVDVLENPADQQLGAVELMFQQGDPPDVFRAQADGFDRMYERGWTHSLEEFVTDDFLARFPEGTMNPATSGLHRDGELYTLPLVTGKWEARPLVVNMAILRENGYDAPPATWSEFEEMARTITANGGGSVFGYAPFNSKAGGVEMFAQTAVPGSVLSDGIDFRTGKPATASPGLVEAVEMHRRMQADGVMAPGWESWDANRPFTEFAAGTIAMYPTPTYQVAEIRKLNPEIEMVVAPMPVPDSGRVAYTPLRQSFSPIWSMSSETEHPEDAWKVMDFLASPEFHQAYYEEFGTLTALEGAWEDQAMDNPDQAAILGVADETVRLIPNPILASEGGAAILQARAQRPELRFVDAAVDAIINDKPFLPIAQELDAQLQTFLDEQVAAGTGTLEDITFPDWDPLENYTPEQ